LAFSPALADQTVAYNTPLAYDINVSSWFSIDAWILNDTTNFAISAAGIVTNALLLAPGVYGLRVSVNDTLGHEVTGEFSVTVEAPLIAPIPLELILVILAVIIIVIILLLLCYYLRKRK
jgi:hypothetical protein